MVTVWVVIYHHKHGVDAWPIAMNKEPTEDEVIKILRKEGSWEDEDDDREDTYVEVRGPWKMGPQV